MCVTLIFVKMKKRNDTFPSVFSDHVRSVHGKKVCSEDPRGRKPHPARLRLALDRLRLSPEVCVYIGDAPEDIQMAHRAGMRAVGVLGGSPVPERLRAASPDATIETIRELPG